MIIMDRTIRVRDNGADGPGVMTRPKQTIFQFALNILLADE